MARNYTKTITRLVLISIVLSACECSTVINKCCELGERLINTPIVECLPYNDTDITIETMFERFVDYSFTVNIGYFPNCSDIMIIDNEKNSLSKNGTYESFSQDKIFVAEYSSSTYCIDQLETEDTMIYDVSLVCPCLDHLCIFKCCPKNKHLESPSNVNCSATTSVDWHYNKLNGIKLKETSHVLSGVPYCDSDEQFSELERDYSIQEDGSIISKYYGKIDPLKYCGDYVYKNGQRESTIMACVKGRKKSWHFKLYAVLNIIAVFFLSLTIFLHLWLPELAGNPGDCLVAHCCCMVVGCISTTINQNFIKHSVSFQCYLTGYLMQYSNLASFFWLNVICLGVYWQFSQMTNIRLNQRNKRSYKFLWQSLYAWGVPAIITMTTIAIDLSPKVLKNSIFKPNFGLTKCWFYDDNTQFIYFYGPMGVLLLINIIFFVHTLWKIHLWRKGSGVLMCPDNQMNTESNKSYIMYIKIFLLMGVSWIMEIVASVVGGPDDIWILTDSFNILRGLLIFIIFCWKPNVWTALKKKMPVFGKIQFLENHFNAHSITRPLHRSYTVSTSSGRHISVEMRPIKNSI